MYNALFLKLLELELKYVVVDLKIELTSSKTLRVQKKMLIFFINQTTLQFKYSILLQHKLR